MTTLTLDRIEKLPKLGEVIIEDGKKLGVVIKIRGLIVTVR